MTMQFGNGSYTTGLPDDIAIAHNNWATQRGLPANFAPQGYGYTAGPAGTAGGLAPNFEAAAAQSQAQQQAGMSFAGGPANPGPLEPGGYGTGPGQSERGYFQQDTPLGAFAAADQQWAQAQAPVQQHWAQTAQAGNPFIGQATQGAEAAGSVMPYAQQGQTNSPWLGGSSGQVAQPGQNPLGMGNPFLQQQIDAASADATRHFQQVTDPQLQRAMQQSGSFGNTGIQALQQQAMRDLGRQLGNISSGMRMQDYTQQQGLAENALNRGMQADMANANLRAGDLSRNLAGSLQQAGMNNGLLMQGAMFDAGQQNQMGQFNAGLRQNDLARNTNAALGLGTFNAGQTNQMGQFNAQQGNQLGLANAQMGQQNAQFNAQQGNAINLQNTGWGNSMLENARNRIQQGGQFDRQLAQQQGQFDANLDRGIWNDNMGWQRQGTQDQIALLNQMLGWSQQGIANAAAIQNTPLQYLQQFAGIGQGLGGLGGQNVQQLYGNPLLGALGGWQLGGALFGGGQ